MPTRRLTRRPDSTRDGLRQTADSRLPTSCCRRRAAACEASVLYPANPDGTNRCQRGNQRGQPPSRFDRVWSPGAGDIDRSAARQERDGATRGDERERPPHGTGRAVTKPDGRWLLAWVRSLLSAQACLQAARQYGYAGDLGGRDGPEPVRTRTLLRAKVLILQLVLVSRANA